MYSVFNIDSKPPYHLLTFGSTPKLMSSQQVLFNMIYYRSDIIHRYVLFCKPNTCGRYYNWWFHTFSTNRWCIVWRWISHIFKVFSSNILHYSKNANCLQAVDDVKVWHSVSNGANSFFFRYRRQGLSLCYYWNKLCFVFRYRWCGKLLFGTNVVWKSILEFSVEIPWHDMELFGAVEVQLLSL